LRPKGVAILGATGSIGETAQRVIARHPERFKPVALTANGNVAKLTEAVARWSPKYVGIVAPGDRLIPRAWGRGAECLIEAVQQPSVRIVLNAVVGAVGLDATLAALKAGKRVALANKETLVIGGALVKRAARRNGGEIIPVDSEHSALLQCCAGRIATKGEGIFPLIGVKRLVITASGGPFRTWESEKIRTARLDDALKHPIWTMGKKITVDSASLANKALEVIEAHLLFGVPYDRIEVVVHPQSIIHSFVEFDDGSVIAQLGVPSMELPILYALGYPDRVADVAIPRFDPLAHSPLTFEPVRHADFPALGLGIAAGRAGGAAPAVYNAANEAAVARVLAGSLAFGRIPAAIETALTKLDGLPGDGRDDLLAADAAARALVMEIS
jgi:1-deoxy-D-xylulose-5-phosphate reductoisomerase